MAGKREVRQLIREIESLGAVVTTRRRHYRIKCPNGALVFMSATPSDYRAIKNARSDLRRIGGLQI
jgi:hypothetical protein